jgi:hypothetical protein
LSEVSVSADSGQYREFVKYNTFNPQFLIDIRAGKIYLVVAVIIWRGIGKCKIARAEEIGILKLDLDACFIQAVLKPVVSRN